MKKSWCCRKKTRGLSVLYIDVPQKRGAIVNGYICLNREYLRSFSARTTAR